MEALVLRNSGSPFYQTNVSDAIEDFSHILSLVGEVKALRKNKYKELQEQIRKVITHYFIGSLSSEVSKVQSSIRRRRKTRLLSSEPNPLIADSVAQVFKDLENNKVCNDRAVILDRVGPLIDVLDAKKNDDFRHIDLEKLRGMIEESTAKKKAKTKRKPTKKTVYAVENPREKQRAAAEKNISKKKIKRVRKITGASKEKK